MNEELERLCQSCGMCCDGSLFQKALLKPEEVPVAKRLGLNVIQDKGFTQPCPALKERSCSVYSERPSVCRSFVCKLFAKHRDQGGRLAPRLAKVRRARELLETLQQRGMRPNEGGTERHFEGEGTEGFEMMGMFSELMTLLEEDFARAVPATRAEPD